MNICFNLITAGSVFIHVSNEKVFSRTPSAWNLLLLICLLNGLSLFIRENSLRLMRDWIENWLLHYLKVSAKKNHEFISIFLTCKIYCKPNSLELTFAAMKSAWLMQCFITFYGDICTLRVTFHLVDGRKFNYFCHCSWFPPPPQVGCTSTMMI